jgi:hypothetical protein
MPLDIFEIMHVTGIILDRNWRSSECKWADQQLFMLSLEFRAISKMSSGIKSTQCG